MSYDSNWPPPPPGATPPVSYTPFPGDGAGPQRSGMAVTALVLGILSCVICMPLGVVAIILGIIALNRVSRDPRAYGGRGLAIAGIATGGAALLLGCLVVPAILIPALARAREISKRVVDGANLRGIATALLTYENENGRFPPDLDTLVAIGTSTAKQMQDPSEGNPGNACDYHYVAGLPKDAPRDWIIAYCSPANHGGEGGNILFVDGHAEFFKEPAFSETIRRFEEACAKTKGPKPRVIPPR